MTVLELIEGALCLCERLRPGRHAAPSETASAFASLKEMVDGWSAERLFIYYILRSQYPLTANALLLGPGGAGRRPVRIESAAIIVNDLRLPVTLINEREWSEIVEESATADAVQMAYCDGLYPTSTVYLWPTPSGNSILELYTWQPLDQLLTTGDTISFPPGYQEALRANLAVRFAAEIGGALRPEVLALADGSRQRIREMNRLVTASPNMATADLLALAQGTRTAAPPAQTPAQTPPPGKQ